MSIILVSSDQIHFTVDLEVAKCSTLIKDMLENLGYEDGTEELIPLANIDGATLKLVVEWAEHHKDDPTPAEEYEEQHEHKAKTSDDISAWDAALVKRSNLMDMILAANYLDIKGLLELTCKTVANMIKGTKTPEQIRAKFGVRNDFTPEEEEQARKENEWVDK